MAATAVSRCILAFKIDPLMAILAELMRSFLETVDTSITHVTVMAAGTFINHHDLTLDMMTNGTAICILVFTVRKISRFAGLFGLQGNRCRTNSYLQTESTTDDKE